MIKDEIVNLIDGFIDDFEQKNIMRYEIAKVIYSALESAGCLKEPSASAREFWLWKNKDGWRVEENHTSEVIDSYGDKQKIIHVREVEPKSTELSKKEFLDACFGVEAPSESKDPLEELEEWLNQQIHEYQTRNTMLSEHGAGELHSFLIVLSKITSLKKENK